MLTITTVGLKRTLFLNGEEDMSNTIIECTCKCPSPSVDDVIQFVAGIMMEVEGGS